MNFPVMSPKSDLRSDDNQIDREGGFFYIKLVMNWEDMAKELYWASSLAHFLAALRSSAFG
jgi:hypothetical protein